MYIAPHHQKLFEGLTHVIEVFKKHRCIELQTNAEQILNIMRDFFAFYKYNGDVGYSTLRRTSDQIRPYYYQYMDMELNDEILELQISVKQLKDLYEKIFEIIGEHNCGIKNID